MLLRKKIKPKRVWLGYFFFFGRGGVSVQYQYIGQKNNTVGSGGQTNPTYLHLILISPVSSSQIDGSETTRVYGNTYWGITN